MAIQEVIDFVLGKAGEFGALPQDNPNRSYMFRNNAKDGPSDANKAYFGLVQPEEEPQGPYHDFSFTVMPAEDGNPWLVSICAGSSGFKNDYELATYPGLRRLFSKLVDNDGVCKSDFSDLTTSLPRSFRSRPDVQHLSLTLATYSSILSACQLVEDPLSENGKQRIAAFIAGYARMREWPSNNAQRRAVMDALRPFLEVEDPVDEAALKKLVQTRRYLVLQGPPGTGKTRMAKLLAQDLRAKTFFTQFHAETTYSDFVYGIRPNLDEGTVAYVEKHGPLTEAISYAIENPEVTTVLIIDEINRANLSNVLGPVFYLFEHKMVESEVQIDVMPGLSIKSLPNNFLVIATMNTADRSLAVVDFALRRRFAWYTLKPTVITGNGFFEKDFTEIQEIFDWYATADELSLQPGQGYFFASSKEEMLDRIRYEIFPLIREYLQEGLLPNAKEELNAYFSRRIGKSLYE
jgi:5-methylcytosine-specific restriction enzyme B